MSICRAIRVITPNDSPDCSIASNTIRTARSRSSGGYRRCAGCEPLDRSDMDCILPSEGVPTRPGAVHADLDPTARAARWHGLVGQVVVGCRLGCPTGVVTCDNT